MKNKLLFSLIFFFNTLFSTFSNEIQYTPENTVLCWDLRGVLLKRNRKPITSISWDIFSGADNKWELIKLVPNYYFWKDVNELVARPDFVMDEVVEILAKKYPALTPHIEKIMDLITDHELIEEVVAILEETNEIGYQNNIHSNIGLESLKRMNQKLPEFFVLFNGNIYVAQDKDNTGKIIAKPRDEFFLNFRKQIDKNPENYKKFAILIDDNQESIDESQKNKELKFIPIKYENPQQLRNIFIGLGILAKKN